MIWIKRISPFVITGFMVWGYFWYNSYNEAKIAEKTDKYSLITAQIWIASAQYRTEPDKYLLYRDSLLEVSGVELEDIKKYLEIFNNEPEENYPFTVQVKKYVDSLFKIADSIRMYEESLNPDTTQKKLINIR